MIGIRQTLLTMVLLLSSVIAMADPDHQHVAPRDMGPHQQAERASFTTNRFEQHEDTIHPAGAEHRSGRLSPDERRELRRQINEVGQDIYRPRN